MHVYVTVVHIPSSMGYQIQYKFQALVISLNTDIQVHVSYLNDWTCHDDSEFEGSCAKTSSLIIYENYNHGRWCQTTRNLILAKLNKK